MSSYPVLHNKPIDQWKVTELKEELKKRRLTTKGLKDDLIRRLDESLQKEFEIANASADKGSAFDSEPAGQYQDAPTMLIVDEKASVIINKTDNKDGEMNIDAVQPNVDVVMGSVVYEQVVGQDTDTVKQVMVAETTKESSVQETTLDTSMETTIVETSREIITEFSPVASESLATKLNMSGQEFQHNGVQNKSEDLNIQFQDENIKPPHEVSKLDSSDPETQVYEVSKAKSDSFSTDNVSVNVKIDELNIQPHENPNPLHEKANVNSVSCETQVFEVSKVTSDSISTDIVSINEQIELKDNIIADDVKLEFNVKQPSSGNVDLDDGILQPMDVKELQESETKVEESENYADNPDLTKKNDSGDVELSEKLNLDRSSGDDSIEDDLLESKQVEPKSLSDDVGDKREKIEVNIVSDEFVVDAMIEDTSTDGNIEKKDVSAVASVKRKSHDQATIGNSETTKRQRKWNSEGVKVLETDNDNASPTMTPKGTIQPNAKRNISRSDPMASVETPKERVVPPSSKPPTNALRIDRFLRPFTLKAVQELLGKTGTVTKFWMDHIKTHCYVSYSSVEEAVETRNAVYNLQWPANGGRLLIAEFVEPQEVQMRLEVPPSPAAPVNTGPILPPPPIPMPSNPSPRVLVKRQAPQPAPTFPVSLPPPPPPSSNPLVARERALPMPPPLPERVEPPIVTLDDLFRKTKATPRIYYLPLSDEQVKAKQDAEAKSPSSRD